MAIAPIDKELIRRRWFKKPECYFEDCLQILPKIGEKEYLNLNAHQKKIQAAIDRQRKADKPVRIIILKPRQTGISTLSCANLFHQVRFNKGTAMVVSMDLDSSEHIFSIIQRFHYYLPDNEKKSLVTLASNRKELKFDEPHGGRIIVETAGKTSAGHSYTIRNLLLSEVSRWPEGCEDTIIGLLNALPRQAGTTAIVESVANGMSGWFYQEWHKQDSDYEKIFLPWFEHDEYRKELPVDAAQYQAQLTDEEKQIVSRFSLTLEQIEWRRWSYRNTCQENWEKFKEQYPATANEAFITSGNTFFHISTLEAIPTSEPLRCNLIVAKDLSHREEIRATPNERGFLRLWKRPEKGHEYVIGADVAEGIEIDDAPAGDRRDYSSADVIDRNTKEQVAHFHGQITPDEFGRQLYLLGRWYNNAFIAIEANGGYGKHVMDTLMTESYSPALLYRRQVLDEATRRMTNKLGWYTTRSNRKSMMSQLDMAIRTSDLLINSPETVGELRTFITKVDGRLEAGSGQKDDRVFSLAIAYQAMCTAPTIRFDLPDDTLKPKAVSYVPHRSIYSLRKPRGVTREPYNAGRVSQFTQ